MENAKELADKYAAKISKNDTYRSYLSAAYKAGLATGESHTKKIAADFAFWYHNGLTNVERKEPEEMYDYFLNNIYKSQCS